MNSIYNFFIFIYVLSIKIASLFSHKAKLWIKGRKNLFEKIEQQLNDNEKRVWFHAASLGEFEQGRPVIEKFRETFPEYKIVLTFFSPSGYTIRKNYEKADYVFYMPPDTIKNARKFVQLVSPEMVFFIKYEFWVNHINTLYKNKIPIFLISAIFRENQIFFKPYGKYMLGLLHKFNRIFVQDTKSLEILRQHGIHNTQLSGDTRFDRVKQITENIIPIPIVEKFIGNKKIFIAGSTWKPDEEIIFDFINNNQNSEYKYIIAPHEVDENNIKRIEKLSNKKNIRFSQLTTDKVAEAKVLIIDNIGLLSTLYSYGTISFVGGGFGSGIHNTLEPATFGMPVIFGPNYKKFKEAVDMINLGCAFSIMNSDQFKEIMTKLISDPNLLEKTAYLSAKYISENTGATDTIISYIAAEIKKSRKKYELEVDPPFQRKEYLKN